MAHEITTRDNLFTVRQAAWHGLGNVLEDYPTIAEAKAIAHPWEPESEPVFRFAPVKQHGNLYCVANLGGECNDPEHVVSISRYEEVDGFQAIVRSDDRATLGVQSNTYEPVTNQQLYDIAEAIQGEASDVMLETGGSLKGGRKVWLLLRLNEPLVVPGDPNGATLHYWALQNSNDGSGAFRGQATSTRIVCDNTSQMADMDAKAHGTEFVFRHSKNVKGRIEEAKSALNGWRESVEEWQRFSAHLIDTKITEAQLREYVDEFIPMPPGGLVSDRVQKNVMDARGTMNAVFESATMEGVKHTAYGLVQGSLEYSQHYRKARTKETRFQRAYLDRSRLTQDAVKLALEVAGA